MPTIDSELLFVLALCPAMFVAVILHEAGHVIAARCVGIDIAAWGVGYRRPWFHIQTGRSTFYLGRPLTGGITIPIRKTIERRPLQEFVMILGGPLATALGLAVGLTIFRLGLRSGVVTAWIYVSACFALLTVVPYEFQSQYMRLMSDGLQLIRVFKNGREAQAVPIGAALGTSKAIVDLLIGVKCTCGMRYFYSAVAGLQAVLGDIDSAKNCLESAREYTDQCSLYHYAQALLAVNENRDDAEDVFLSALDACRGDATAVFGIECMRENWRAQHGYGDRERRKSLRERALKVSRRDWQCWSEMIDFEAEWADDVEAHCRRIKSVFHDQLNGVAAARMLAVTSLRLASQRNLERAEVLFREAEAAIAREAAAIADATTREEYLRSAERPLLEVTGMAGIPRPDFASAMLEKHAVRRRLFAYASLAAIVPSFLASLLGACLAFVGEESRVERFFLAAETIAVLGALLTLAAIAVSIFRSEQRRWSVLSVTLTLAFLTMAIAAVTMAQFNP